MKASEYGDKYADVYDALYGPPSEASLVFLQEEAGGGPVLELGIGTGRVALELKRRGVEIHGIEISPRMVEKLREKPGGKDVPVIVGSFAEIPETNRYTMVFGVFNTFFGLLTRDDQMKGLASIASALKPGGKLILEAIVPDLSSFQRNQALSVVSVTAEEVVLTASLLNPSEQTLVSQKIHISESGIRMFPTTYRYLWPSELDLMAGQAGLELTGRYGGWSRQPFTRQATAHVSVFRKP